MGLQNLKPIIFFKLMIARQLILSSKHMAGEQARQKFWLNLQIQSWQIKLIQTVINSDYLLIWRRVMRDTGIGLIVGCGLAAV
jgi:hypothetical protein